MTPRHRHRSPAHYPEEQEALGVGSCYGFSVRSDLPFQFIRPGGEDPLKVGLASDDHPLPTRAPLLTWDQAPGRSFARFYGDGDRYSLWIDEMGWFFVDPAAPSIDVPRRADPVRREVRLWSFPISLCLVERGDVSLHGAAIDVGGTALVFAAPGRHGKTTLASAFLQAGYRLLSEDLTCVRPEGSPSVLPGPAVMRVRRDSYARLEFPGMHVVAEDPDRVYLSVDESLRGDGRPVPIGAVVFLRKSSRGLSMERVSAADSLRDLWALSFTLPTDESKRRCFQSLTAIAASVPVWNVHRELRFDDLGSLVDRLVTAFLG